MKNLNCAVGSDYIIFIIDVFKLIRPEVVWESAMDLGSALVVTSGSVCGFKLVNALMGRLLPPPEPACWNTWEWGNIATSLIHSSLTGTWAILCLYVHPQVIEDPIHSHTSFSHSLVAVSTGYFIHDSLDMATNLPLKQSWEMLLHHSMVIPCFSLAIISRRYVGLAVICLLVEINSIFLHIRQLLLLSGPRNRVEAGVKHPSPSMAFRVTSALNLATFLVFRICNLGFLVLWLVRHAKHLPWFALTLGAVGLSVISTMNTVLFYRLLLADLLTHTPPYQS